MDHFERELARMMRDTREHTAFEPKHQDRLRAGVRARSRVRAAQKAAGSVLPVAGLALGLFLLPGTSAEVRPQAPPPRPATSPTYRSPSPTPDASPTDTSTPTATSTPEAGGRSSATPTAPATTGTATPSAPSTTGTTPPSPPASDTATPTTPTVPSSVESSSLVSSTGPG